MTLQFSNLTWEGKRTCDWVCRSLFVWTTLHGSPGASHRSRIPKVLTDYMEHHHTHHQHHGGYSEHHRFPSVKIETSKFNLHLQQDDVKMTFDVAPAAAPNLRQSSARSTECVTFLHLIWNHIYSLCKHGLRVSLIQNHSVTHALWKMWKAICPEERVHVKRQNGIKENKCGTCAKAFVKRMGFQLKILVWKNENIAADPLS